MLLDLRGLTSFLNKRTETDYAQLRVGSFTWRGYKCPSRNKERNCSEHGPECKNGERDHLLENEMVWFHFLDKVFADGPNSFSLLGCRLLNTCDEEVADNDIFIWVARDTAPGGEVSSFNVNKNRTPVDHFIKGVRHICLDDESPLFKSISNDRELELDDRTLLGLSGVTAIGPR